MRADLVATPPIWLGKGVGPFAVALKRTERFDMLNACGLSLGLQRTSLGAYTRRRFEEGFDALRETQA